MHAITNNGIIPVLFTFHEKELTKNVFENPTIQEWQLRDLTEPLDDPAELLRDIVKAIIMDIDENILVMDESSDYKNYEIKEEDLSFDSYITETSYLEIVRYFGIFPKSLLANNSNDASAPSYE